MIAFPRRAPEGPEAVAERMIWRKVGDEWRGPCPACGGDGRQSDRAGVRRHRAGPPKVLISCRRCTDRAALQRAVDSVLGPEPADPAFRPTGRSRRDIRRDIRRRSKAAQPMAQSREMVDTGADIRIARCRHAWAASERCGPHSAPAQHLVSRSVLDPGASPPAAIRWMPRERLGRFLTRPVRLGSWPDEAAGAMLAASTDRAGQVCGIEALPLTADGRRFETPAGADRIANGRPGQGAVRIPGGAPAGPVAVVEATVDALAVHRAVGGVLREIAALGGSAWRPSRLPTTDADILLIPDPDEAGRLAARRMRESLPTGAVAVEVVLPLLDPTALIEAGRMPDLAAAVEGTMRHCLPVERRIVAARSGPAHALAAARAALMKDDDLGAVHGSLDRQAMEVFR